MYIYRIQSEIHCVHVLHIKFIILSLLVQWQTPRLIPFPVYYEWINSAEQFFSRTILIYFLISRSETVQFCSSFQFINYILFTSFVCKWVWMYHKHEYGKQRATCTVCFFYHRMTWGLNSGHQTYQQSLYLLSHLTGPSFRI